MNSISEADDGFNDKVSSVVVLSGTWELFSDRDFGGRKLTLTPNAYDSLENAGCDKRFAEPAGPGWNDTMSSLRVKSW